MAVTEGTTSIQIMPNLPFSMAIMGASQTGKEQLFFICFVKLCSFFRQNNFFDKVFKELAQYVCGQ